MAAAESRRMHGWAALASLFFLSGCLEANPEELNRLVKEDPAFKQMIAQRDQAHRDIQMIRQEMLNKKKIMDADVQKLRTSYDAYSKEQNKKMDALRALIDANRLKLKKEIAASQEELSKKTEELTGYDRTLADVKKVLSEGKGLQLSKLERQKWEERMLILSEKMRPLSEEVQELKLAIRLKKQKIAHLK